jgi:hypothetical protein
MKTINLICAYVGVFMGGWLAGILWNEWGCFPIWSQIFLIFIDFLLTADGILALCIMLMDSKKAEK